MALPSFFYIANYTFYFLSNFKQTQTFKSSNFHPLAHVCVKCAGRTPRGCPELWRSGCALLKDTAPDCERDLATVARSLTSKSEIRTWESEEESDGCCNHDK